MNFRFDIEVPASIRVRDTDRGQKKKSSSKQTLQIESKISWCEKVVSESTCCPLENQVDGLPGVLRNTKSV